MQICVLGSCRAARPPEDPAGEPAWLDVGSRKPRAVLSALALSPGTPVSAEQLADLVWGGEPPRAAHGALHAYISGLRKVLEPDRQSRGVGEVLGTTDHGYVLHVAPMDVDAHAFASEVRACERGLAPLASQLSTGASADWPDRAAVGDLIDRLDAALALWTGEPYADLPDHPDVLAQRAGLDRLRGAAEELRLLGLLALGEHASVLSATEAATTRHPWRERLWALHALALTRAGRQAEALEALRTLRGALADELGIDPSTEVRGLEQAILQQAPGLHDVLASTPVATPPSPAEPRPRAAVAAPEAPVGRAAERDVLHRLLEGAASGRAGFAQVVGEPGIGKTRIVDEIAAAAPGLGLVVGTGRCSQDDGAPPLWAWLAVLESIERATGTQLTGRSRTADPQAGPGQVAFETWDRIASGILETATRMPVLVVLDDLHWADEATLRTLTHLLATAPADARLCVVATRRAHPEPSGALAQVGEAFARRHAERVELTGLDRAGAADLLREVVGEVEPATIDAWLERSEGNPFFLVELARLGADDPDEVPATVRDVVTRRLDLLPDRALDTLRTASVVGRRFRPEVVASAGDRELDVVADDLDQAIAAGLVAEVDVEEMAFSHALTRDAVYLTLTASRRARRHAQVAHALDTDEKLRLLFRSEELTAELARHWLDAGPSHADTAWRAARDAATLARGLSAYGEAARLGRAAVEAHQRVPGTGEEERYQLLLDVARDAAYAARWFDVVAAAFEAIALGRSLASPEKVGEAAVAITRYAVWTPHEWQTTFEDVIEDLRWALEHVADDDIATRARLQLALAAELYYDAGARAERHALVETGIALARRTGDPALLAWAARAAWISSWAPSLTEDRVRYAEEGLAAARAAGDHAAEAVHLVSLATDHMELGRIELWHELSGEAERIALREKLPYVLLTLHWVEFNLATMRHQADVVERRTQALNDVSREIEIPGNGIQAPATIVLSRLWNGTLADVIEGLLWFAEEEPMSYGSVHGMLARAGLAERLADWIADHPYTEPQESWQTLASYSLEAEAAAALGNRAMAGKAREQLAPYAGRMAVAGVATAHGPVDGYLALAAATLGDGEVAAAHADRALALADAWDLPAYREWLEDLRARRGF